MSDHTDTERRLAPPRTPSHPSARALEALAFDGDATHSGTPLAEHTVSCAACRAEVDRLRSERSAFLESRPAAAFVAQLEEAKFELRPGRRLWRWIAPPVALAACAAVALVLTLPEPPDVRMRGEATLVVHVSHGGGPATPYDGEALAPGDVLRFVVGSGEPGYAYVANLDDRGHVTPYVPADGTRSVPIEAGDRVVLPGSIALDEFAGEERVFLFVSREPLDGATVASSLGDAYHRAGGRLGAVDDVAVDAAVSTVMILKRAPEGPP